MKPWSALTVLLCAAGCSRSVDKPVPPDMSALVATYATPTGTFDDTAAAEIVAYLEGLGNAFALALTDEIRKLFSSVNQSIDEPTQQPMSDVATQEGGGITIEGDAFVVLTRICDGFQQPRVADPSNGQLVLNVNMTDVNIDPVVWLTTSACHYTTDVAMIQIDEGPRSDVGDIRVYIGPGGTADNILDRPFIIDVELAASIDVGLGPATADIDFDFAVSPGDPQLSVRVPTSSGDIIAIASPGRQLLGVRAANGEFSCDPIAMICTGDNGDVVNF